MAQIGERSRLAGAAVIISAQIVFLSGLRTLHAGAPVLEPRKIKPTDGSVFGRDRIIFQLTDDDFLDQSPNHTPEGQVMRALHAAVIINGRKPSLQESEFQTLAALFYSKSEGAARPFFSDVIAPALDNERKSPNDPEAILQAARVRDILGTIYVDIGYILAAQRLAEEIFALEEKARAGNDEQARAVIQEKISEALGHERRSKELRSSLSRRYPKYAGPIDDCFEAHERELRINSGRRQKALADVDKLFVAAGLEGAAISGEFKNKFLSPDPLGAPLVPLYYELWQRVHQEGGVDEAHGILTALGTAAGDYEAKRIAALAISPDGTPVDVDSPGIQALMHKSMGNFFDGIDSAAAKTQNSALQSAIIAFGDRVIPDYRHVQGIYGASIRAGDVQGIRFKNGESVVMRGGPHDGMTGYFEMTRGALSAFVVEGNAPQSGRYEVRRFGLRVNEDGSLESLGWVSREAVDPATSRRADIPLADLAFVPAPAPVQDEASGSKGDWLDLIKEGGRAALDYAALPLRYLAGAAAVSAGSTIALARPCQGSETERISLGLIEWGASTMAENDLTGNSSFSLGPATFVPNFSYAPYAMAAVPDFYMASYQAQLEQSRDFYRSAPFLMAGIDRETFDQAFLPMAMGFQGIDDEAVMLGLAGWNGQQLRWNYLAQSADAEGRSADAATIRRLASAAAFAKLSGEVFFTAGVGWGSLRWIASGSARAPVVLGAHP
ncbi:MAG: hypothetical protein HY547_02520 [Elusimicrobia bacterium]|nr:hypothetical protein [Elusimicrobiota bacterium]